MADNPGATRTLKRQRVDDEDVPNGNCIAEDGHDDQQGSEDEALGENYEKAVRAQTDIMELNAAHLKAMAELGKKYDAEKQDLFARRSKCLQQVPGFWPSAIFNSGLGSYFSEHDLEVLNSLVSLDITSDDDGLVHHIDFTFDETPFFGTCVLRKEVRTLETSEVQVCSAPIPWKEGMNLEVSKAEDGEPSLRAYPFLEWYVSEGTFEAVSGDVIAEEFKKVHENPIEAYNGTLVAGEDEEGLEIELEETEGDGPPQIKGMEAMYGTELDDDDADARDDDDDEDDDDEPDLPDDDEEEDDDEEDEDAL